MGGNPAHLIRNVIERNGFMIFSYDNFVKYGLWFSALVSLFDAPNMIALYVVIPLVFLYCFTRYRVYYENRYIVILSCFILFVLFSCVTTHYLDLTIAQLKSLLGTFMMCYIVSSLSIEKKKIAILYSIWIAHYIGILLYIPQMEVFQNFDYSKNRLDDENLNANTIAYYTFFLTFVIYVLGEILDSEKARNRFRLAFFITVPLSFVVALLTGSRQVLLIQIPLIAFLVCVRYISKLKNAKTSLIGILLIAAASIFAVEKGKAIFEKSVLATRYEKDVKKGSRSKLLKDAIKVGCESPILGVGPGNYVKFSFNRHFSHCTYTEVFANCGIFALFFYVYLLWIFIKKQFQYYRETNNNIFLAFFIFGVLYVFDNFFYVFYYKIWLLSFFFLVASHSEYYYREITSKHS